MDFAGEGPSPPRTGTNRRPAVYLRKSPREENAVLRRAGSIVVVGFLLVLLIPNAGLAGGCHGSSEATSGKGAGKVLVDISRCGYSPAILYVEPGTEVSWTNLDPMPHTVTGMGMSLGGLTEFDAGEETKAYRFEDEGVYPYYCFLHPGMAGAVVVGDVSAEKAAAAEQSIPVAAPVADDQPPTTPTKSGSFNVVPISIALVALAAAGAFVFGRRRKEREPQPA
ncbi:MAG: hypothetical protein GEU71_01265 [Actinobacteria bacterium]|nr:hypothetical protein [Actinomycetota bacterium]